MEYPVPQTWTPQKLRSLMAELRRFGGDKHLVEVKRGEGGVPHVGETLSAFGNSPNGGLIVIGVDERSGFTVTGVKNIAEIQQGIASQARNENLLKPPVTVRFSDVHIDGKDVVVCAVDPVPLSERPCTFKGKAYLRQADGDYELSSVDLLMIDNEKLQAEMGAIRNPSDRQAVSDSSMDDLDAEITNVIIKNARRDSAFLVGLSDKDVLHKLGAVTKEGTLTVAGAYVMSEYPQQWVPSWGASAAKQIRHSLNNARTQNLLHIEGPVPSMFLQLMNWAAETVPQIISYEPSGHAFDRLSIPEVAIRELIANALVHRDVSPLSQGKYVDVRLKDNVLTISSPGGLRGVTISQLGSQYCRRPVNETIYRLCEKYTFENGARLIEAEGSGIAHVRHKLLDAGLQEPLFFDTGVTFTAKVSAQSLLDDTDLEWLSTHYSKHDLTPDARIVLITLRNEGKITAAQVRSDFGIDGDEAHQMLESMEALGIIAHSEDGTYTLSDSGQPTRKLGALGVAIAQYLSHNDKATTKQIATDLGVTERRVRYQLDQLSESGFVTFTGKKPIRYSWNG